VNVVTVRHIDDVAIRPLSFEDVLRMVEVGIMDAHDRVELVDGVLVEMSPEGIDHADVTADVNRLLTDAYPSTFDVRAATTHPLDEWQFRQPDFVVSHRIRRRWLASSDVVLVVEVAKTSIRYDIGRKARDYAAWGVRDYWVIDIDSREIVVHTAPSDGRYRTVTRVSETTPLRLPDSDAELRLTDILPPAPAEG
jgi:Uma2 family endonuclease